MKMWLMVFLFLFISFPSSSKNLGNYGQTFNIIEIPFVPWVKHVFAELQEKGILSKFENDMKNSVKREIKRPQPVKGLSTTDHPREFYVDPTVVTPKNVYDFNGNVIIKKGTVVNPFKTKSLAHYKWHWVFFNADDIRQIHWAESEIKKYPNSLKVVLVDGDIDKAYMQLHHQIYFDQFGFLSKKFKLRHIPVLIQEKNYKWFIQEFTLRAMQ